MWPPPCSCTTGISRMPAGAKMSIASMKAEPMMPNMRVDALRDQRLDEGLGRASSSARPAPRCGRRAVAVRSWQGLGRLAFDAWNYRQRPGQRQPKSRNPIRCMAKTRNAAIIAGHEARAPARRHGGGERRFADAAAVRAARGDRRAAAPVLAAEPGGGHRAAQAHAAPHAAAARGRRAGAARERRPPLRHRRARCAAWPRRCC